MSKYTFKAMEVTRIEAFGRTQNITVELDLDTKQAKEAFLTLAGDCRGNELGEWMEELGYTITEIDSGASEEAEHLAELNRGYARSNDSPTP